MRLAAGESPSLGPEIFAAIGLEVTKRAIEAYRKSNNLLDLLGSRIGAVSMTTVGDQQIFGSNSTSPTYTGLDRAAANNLRDLMVDKYPDVMKTDDLGQKPNDAIYHAETTTLLRAAKANGGDLSGQTLEVVSDRPLCQSCKAVLPYVGLELGNPTVTFVDTRAGVRQTIQNGKWVN